MLGLLAQQGSILDGRTLIPLGVCAAIAVVAIGAAYKAVIYAMSQVRETAERNTRVDMTLKDHGDRIAETEATQRYLYDAVRRIEFKLGTLPPDVPLPPRN